MYNNVWLISGLIIDNVMTYRPLSAVVVLGVGPLTTHMTMHKQQIQAFPMHVLYIYMYMYMYIVYVHENHNFQGHEWPSGLDVDVKQSPNV